MTNRFLAIILPFIALGVASPALAHAKPGRVFDAYERGANAGDIDAISKLVSPTASRPPHYACPTELSDHDCLLNYLDFTVVKRHSVLTTLSKTVDGDTVRAKVELRNDMTRRIGVDRIAGTDVVTVIKGKITSFEFARDEADEQTMKFFQGMAKMGPPPR